jgi:hypothetical protein
MVCNEAGKGGSMADDSTHEINVHYEKSRYFRVIHADGFYGGVAPNGSLHFSLYNERYPLPRLSAIPVDIAGLVVGPEAVKEAKIGVFRELEADVITDFNGAIALSLWLDAKIKEMAQRNKFSDQQLEEMKEAFRKANGYDSQLER